MSYVVFALKWRPQSFDEVVGQDNVVLKLKGALEKKRLAHAYLFAGPRGVGKTSVARIFAKALNCQNGPTTNPCGKCVSCREIAEGRSLDVIEIDGASNTGVDDVRNLRESVKFAPVSGKFKIYIIDEVHMLSTAAFNALLKTLEEPPPFVKFIFATTQPNKVIPTVLSRCQRFDFRRISTREIVDKLNQIVQAENINVDKDVLFAIAKASDGSLRDAESILDQLVSFSKERLSLQDVISMLGLVEEEALFNLSEKISKKDPAGCLEILNHIIDEGKDTAVFLDELIEHFRNIMITKVFQANEELEKLIDLPKERLVLLNQQAKEFSLSEILNIFDTLVNAKEMAKRLDSQRIPLEVTLVKLAYAPKQTNKIHSVQPPTLEIKNNPVKKEDPVLPSQKETETTISQEPLNLKNVSLDQVNDAWQNIIDRLGQIKISLATYLNEGKPIKIENNILTVSFPEHCSLHCDSLAKKENKAIIEKILADLFGGSFRVNFVLSKETSSKTENIENPFIKSALQTFNARIIKQD